jgi:8-oxo-dGTP diphosphatase
MKHVAVGIIMKDGQLLACQRRRNSRYPLKWEFPGGKIEAGETAREALARELREELSINATVERQVFRQEWTYPENAARSSLPGSQANHDGLFDVYYYLIRSYTGEIVNNAFEAIMWVSPSELQSMDILEGNREVVQLLVNHAHELEAS